MAKKVKILFLTDPTRPVESRLIKGFPEPAAMSFMIRDLMAAQLEWMVEGDLEFVTAGADPAFSFGRFYEAIGTEMTLEAWAALNVTLPEVPSDLAAEFDVDLIIAYEIPVSMKEWLLHRGVPFVELSSHPVRFMKDSLLGVDLGIEDPLDVLNEASVDRLAVAMEAGYLKAFMRTPARASSFPSGSSMFIGQKAVDRAMITKDGRFLSGQELAEKMAAAIPSAVGPMFLKLHPLDKGDNDAVGLLRKLAAIAGDFGGNIYSALASDDLERVITVSSSVGVEAHFFGKDVSYVTGPSVPVTFKGEASKPGHWQTASSRFFEPEFLALLLSGVLPIRRGVLSSARFSYSREMLPNRLRNMFNSYYGYSFVSNDPIVENSKLSEVVTHRRAVVMSSIGHSKRIEFMKKRGKWGRRIGRLLWRV